MANVGALRFPYFSFSSPDGTAVYEWQIHPQEHGTLRYTLVQLNDEASGTDTDSSSSVRAIYHHIGYHGSLFLPQSEGVLLLPELSNNGNEWLESVIVASLIGLLWRIRGMEIGETEPKADRKKKRSLIKRVFGRK
jgi:hypothetical protein